MSITISGLGGSGKTTVAKLLAKKLNLSHISAGEIFRKKAEEKNMSLLEFSRYADRHPGADYEIDERIAGYAKTMSKIVLEGKLTGWVVHKYGLHTLKVWLSAPLPVRVKRIAERDKKSYQSALEQLQKREKSEQERYRQLYRINLNDLSIYSLIVSTKNLSPEEIVNRIVKGYKNPPFR